MSTELLEFPYPPGLSSVHWHCGGRIGNITAIKQNTRKPWKYSWDILYLILPLSSYVAKSEPQHIVFDYTEYNKERRKLIFVRTTNSQRRASYGVSFLSFLDKWYREISRVHCIIWHAMPNFFRGCDSPTTWLNFILSDSLAHLHILSFTLCCVKALVRFYPCSSGSSTGLWIIFIIFIYLHRGLNHFSEGFKMAFRSSIIIPFGYDRRRHLVSVNIYISYMMTPSNGNIFRVTDHLCGEFTGPRWIPRAKASDAELWRSLICAWINV